MGASQKKLFEPDSNLEIYSLIWLTSSISNNDENMKIQHKLRTIINHIKLFDDSYLFENYLRSINSSYERFILIINDCFARDILPRIEQLRHVCSIYIYSLENKLNQQWIEQFLKVKCLTEQFDTILTRIQSDHIIDDLFSIVFYNTNQSNKHFIYSHLLFDCLVRMKTNTRNEFLSSCRIEYKDNDFILKHIDEFERNYTSNQSLLWYTNRSFIYRILNKALQIENIDLLFQMRFFIQDLEKQIQEYKCLYSICVYHCHLMSLDEIELFQKSIGHFISINTYLLANFDRGLELFHLYEQNDLEKVLFEINADHQLNDNRVLFANIFNSFLETQQIIFTCGAIFQIENVSYDDNDIWIIKMKLTSENTDQLIDLFHTLKIDYHYGEKTNTIFSFGQYLIKENDFDHAELFYLRLMNEYSHEINDIEQCYIALGQIKKCQHQYDSSLQWFKKVIDNKSENDFYLNECYNNMGEIYEKLSDYKNSIDSYNKALISFMNIYNDDHPKLISCLNNLGIVYKIEEQYIQALNCHQRALTILRKYQSKNYFEIAISYNNIGVIYRHIEQYNLALENYQHAIHIYEKYCVNSQMDLAKTYRNIAVVYEDINQLDQALIYFRKAINIYKNVLPTTHDELIQIEQKIQYISSHI